jgi:hypothetical protein
MAILIVIVSRHASGAQEDAAAAADQATSQPPRPAFSGLGPLPARNFQPIQLIFLNLPFERARVLAPGEFALRLESAEINEIATDQGEIQATLKFETNRTVFGGSLGVYPHLEVGLDIPMLSRFGGFMDPVIDSVENFFGAHNPERSLFPNNTFGGFHVQRDDIVLFDGPDQQFALGDMWLSTKYEMWQPLESLIVSARGAVKLPTGDADEVWGSGKPDFGLGVAAEYPALNWLMIYGNLDGIFPVGPVANGNLTLHPFVIQEVAFEARLFADWASFLVQQELYSSPFHGTGSVVLQGTVIELAVGFNIAWRNFLLQIGGIDNVSGVAQAADFTLLGRVTYKGNSDWHF